MLLQSRKRIFEVSSTLSERTPTVDHLEQLRVKNKELKNLKGLSQMILDQRSDVEQFFLESLEQIKEEVRRKRIANKKTSLPDIHEKSTVSQDSVK